MRELEYCPFCARGSGEVVEEALADGIVYHMVLCNHCDAMGPPRRSEEAAIAAWNLRPTPEPTI